MHATARQLHCLTNVFNNSFFAQSARSASNRLLLARNFTPFQTHRQLATMAPTGKQTTIPPALTTRILTPPSLKQTSPTAQSSSPAPPAPASPPSSSASSPSTRTATASASRTRPAARAQARRTAANITSSPARTSRSWSRRTGSLSMRSLGATFMGRACRLLRM
jgi:hypothetical protein